MPFAKIQYFTPDLEWSEPLLDTRVFMTIAADVVLAGIREPVRFSLECKARIFHEHERFWYVQRKTVVEKYFLRVKPV